MRDILQCGPCLPRVGCRDKPSAFVEPASSRLTAHSQVSARSSVVVHGGVACRSQYRYPSILRGNPGSHPQMRGRIVRETRTSGLSPTARDLERKWRVAHYKHTRYSVLRPYIHSMGLVVRWQLYNLREAPKKSRRTGFSSNLPVSA